MIINASVPLKAKPMTDGSIVLISLVVIGKAGSQMRSDETDMSVCVVESDGDGTFVACHSGKTGFLHRALNVLDLGEDRRAYKNAKCRTHKLATPQQHVLLAVDFFGAVV